MTFKPTHPAQYAVELAGKGGIKHGMVTMDLKSGFLFVGEGSTENGTFIDKDLTGDVVTLELIFDEDVVIIKVFSMKI